jgi:hypothetical protein
LVASNCIETEMRKESLAERNFVGTYEGQKIGSCHQPKKN